MNTIIGAIQNLNRCDWYVFFWCIYQMQEILYEPGPINQGIQVLIMAWAIYEAGIYMLPQRRLPLLLKTTSLLLFMYFIYGSIFIIFGSDFYGSPSNYLKSFVNSFLPIYLFYKYSQKGYVDEKRLRIYFIIFLCIIIPQFYHTDEVRKHALQMSGRKNDEVTNNAGYYFVSLLPMIYFWYKNRLIQYGSLCVILLFVLMAMKRGAIIIASACVIWFLWDNVRNATKKKQKYQTIIFAMVLVALAVGTVSYQLASSDYFQDRLEETKKGNSSGRDRIYSKIIDLVVDDNSYSHLFFGRGAYSTLKETQKLAHHDWLETVCNNGLLGVVILSSFFYAFYRTARDSQEKFKPEYKTCMLMLFFASFVKTWFSMSLENMPIYVTMPMAYLTYNTYKGIEDISAAEKRDD